MSIGRPGQLEGVALAILLVLGGWSSAQAQSWGDRPGPGPGFSGPGPGPGGPGYGGPGYGPPGGGPHHPHWGGPPPGGMGPEPGWWNRGRWWRGWHENRDGWWWIAGGRWHWYPQPVYPVPPPAFQPAPVIVPGFYYYCGNPAGYYPQVGGCLVPWQMVQARARWAIVSSGFGGAAAAAPAIAHSSTTDPACTTRA